MKKCFALLLALALIFSLAACGGGDDEKTPSNNDKTTESTGQPEEKASETDLVEDKGGWPDDKYTAHAPTPTFATFVENTESEFGDYYAGTYYFSLDEDVDIDAVKAYAEELQAMGFTKNVKISDDPAAYDYYTFKGTNPDTKVQITLSMYIEHDDRDSSRKLTINIDK